VRAHKLAQAEVKAVVKRRTHFEYALRRRIPRKADFLRYAEYELNLEALRQRRKQRLGSLRVPVPTKRDACTGLLIRDPTAATAAAAAAAGSEPGASEHAGARRMHFIFRRALRRFPGDVRLWLQYLDYAHHAGAHQAVGRILARSGARPPGRGPAGRRSVLTRPHIHTRSGALSPARCRHIHSSRGYGFWPPRSSTSTRATWSRRAVRAGFSASAVHFYTNMDGTPSLAALLQRALRLNAHDVGLWVEYARLELLYLAKVRERQSVLGLLPEADGAEAVVDVPALAEEDAVDGTTPVAQVRQLLTHAHARTHTHTHTHTHTRALVHAWGQEVCAHPS
jgi:hypothetical protein